MSEPALELHSGRPTELDPVTLYRILQLRVDVFVVEQACPYPELDGRDLEPTARWLWATADGQLVATLRVLFDAERVARIGRVATAAGARSSGVGGRLLNFALAEIAGAELGPEITVLLDAQSQLQGWYQRFGFVQDGPEYLEDGIAHVPMRRSGQPAGGS